MTPVPAKRDQEKCCSPRKPTTIPIPTSALSPVDSLPPPPAGKWGESAVVGRDVLYDAPVPVPDTLVNLVGEGTVDEDAVFEMIVFVPLLLCTPSQINARESNATIPRHYPLSSGSLPKPKPLSELLFVCCVALHPLTPRRRRGRSGVSSVGSAVQFARV